MFYFFHYYKISEDYLIPFFNTGVRRSRRGHEHVLSILTQRDEILILSDCGYIAS